MGEKMETLQQMKGNSKSALEIHNEMYEKYRKEVELIGSLASEELQRLAPEVTPFHKHTEKENEQ